MSPVTSLVNKYYCTNWAASSGPRRQWNKISSPFKNSDLNVLVSCPLSISHPGDWKEPPQISISSESAASKGEGCRRLAGGAGPGGKGGAQSEDDPGPAGAAAAAVPSPGDLQVRSEARGGHESSWRDAFKSQRHGSELPLP